ncbi:MAG: outer membrane biogenesis lipoprotein LolB [Gammaproteobacteria bacterium]|jgi:outer membrane biogenesis lipoprotein LolB
MNNFIKVFLMLVSCSIFVACSDESNSSADAKKDHVWKEQTDTIDKAKEVEGMMMESAAATRKLIDEESE